MMKVKICCYVVATTVLCGVLLTAGCATRRGEASLDKSLPVWPPPPSQARVSYVRSLYGLKDMDVKLSVWRRLLNFIADDDKGVEAFVKPLAVAVDEDGNLCIVDHGAAKIIFYDRSSRKCRQWKRIGGHDLVSPVAFVNKGDTFFVADTQLGKVLAFDRKGRILFELKESIKRPSGLAISGDKLLVADSHLHRISVFGLNGIFLYWFGERGSGKGELNFPTHISVGAGGRIYVTDSMNSRVQVFGEDGEYVNMMGDAGDSSGRFNRPKGIALDKDMNIYVADAIFDNLQVFDSGGRFLMHLGRAGSDPGQFWMPSGVAVDRLRSQLYVADSYNHRIQVFELMSEEGVSEVR